MTTKARVTAQELWRLGEGDVRRELVNGEVVEMAPVGGVHGRVMARICHWLTEHVERQGRGEGGGVPVGSATLFPRRSA